MPASARALTEPDAIRTRSPVAFDLEGLSGGGRIPAQATGALLSAGVLDVAVARIGDAVAA
jgi:hypothetical protein